MDKGKFGRLDRLVKEKRRDPYQIKEKFPEPTVCTSCGAVFTGGRWVWMEEKPQKANRVLCPACRRIKEKMPAGNIVLSGRFLKSHGQEILNLVRNEEKAEKALHPLERIMDIHQDGDIIEIHTTGIHLAKRIGEAIRRSYQGDYQLEYPDGEKSVRITWHRD
ncbi:MAG: ATPase [Thermodesulfobacteria bacterium]|nr:ATPase [Thermodesulfobacteriota bacterium]